MRPSEEKQHISAAKKQRKTRVKRTEPDFCNTPSVKSAVSKLRFKKTILARTPDRNPAPLAKNMRPAEENNAIFDGQK